MSSSQIHAVQTVSGNQPRVRRIIEEAGNTVAHTPPGIPVEIDATDGGVKVWDGTTLTAAIAGFSLENGNNLATTGVPQTLSYGSVPYESSAKNIPMGAPLNDGRIGLEVSAQDTVFRGQVGPAQTVAASNVGKSYGLTVDTDFQWYVDLTKTTTSGGGGSSEAVVTIVKLDPQDESATPRGVYFTVLPAAAQIVA